MGVVYQLPTVLQGGYYISFDPMLFTIPTCTPNEITPPFSFDINVNLR